MNKSRKSKIENLQNLTMEEIMFLVGQKDSKLGIVPIRDYVQLNAGLSRNAYGKKIGDYESSLESCDLMNPEWKTAISSKWWAKVNRGISSPNRKKYGDFMRELLQIAGEEVCFQAGDPDFELIQEYGQFWFGKNVKMMPGTPSRCHENSAFLWNENRENTLICTGYALSKDGMWRQHSWCIKIGARSNQIIETTKPRIAYFGVCLTYEKCQNMLESYL